MGREGMNPSPTQTVLGDPEVCLPFTRRGGQTG